LWAFSVNEDSRSSTSIFSSFFSGIVLPLWFSGITLPERQNQTLNDN
jgi:hypothetical protein